MIIPYDIIYKIYFYVDDYTTLTKFWTLSKTFYNHYMRKYNISYRHKYNIVYDDLFFFLSLLPKTDCINTNINRNVNFYKTIVGNSDSNLQNDIQFIYRLYNLFFIKYFTIFLVDYELYKQSERLTSILLMQGVDFIKLLVDIEFHKNKVILKSKFLNRYDMLNIIRKVCVEKNSYIRDSHLQSLLLLHVHNLHNLYKYFI